MELTIQSVNFEASDQLKAFAEKRVNKILRLTEDIIQSAMLMKLLRPDAPNKKEVSIKLNI